MDFLPYLYQMDGTIRKEIFIADDDQVFLQAIEARLTQAGYLVNSALDGQIALVKLRTKKYDLLLLDIMMPYYSGVEILSEIKALYPDVPVIIISALEAQELIFTAFEIGANEFILKPVNLDELLLRIEKFI